MDPENDEVIPGKKERRYKPNPFDNRNHRPNVRQEEPDKISYIRLTIMLRANSITFVPPNTLISKCTGHIRAES
jgi:hypothetical protein